jgi:hypothetical protein
MTCFRLTRLPDRFQFVADQEGLLGAESRARLCRKRRVHRRAAWASANSREAETIAQTQGHYDDAIRDTFIAQKRQYHIRRTDDQDFLTQLQRAADWLYARKVLPGQVRITDCVATV